MSQLIEGRRVEVQTIDWGLPPKMDALLTALFGVTQRADIVPGGTSVACEVWRTHRFQLFRLGRFFPVSGVVLGQVLDLRLNMCADCGAVEVRDISYDRSFDGEPIPVGRKGPNRRDRIIGHYSGARRGGREYS